MATEVDTPEQISQKMKEAEDIGLLQPLNVAFNQHHSEETKEPESRHNQPLETSNYVGEKTLMVEEKDIELDNETAVDVEADEDKNIFLSPSVPKFTTEVTSSEKKDYKASDIPNLAEREMTKNETLVEEIDHAEIRPSEEGREDKNERVDVLKSTEDVCISTEIEPSYNQNEEKVIEKGQGTEVSTPLINELIEDTTAEKTAPDKGGEKIDETFGEKDLVSTEDKTQFKPQICQNEMESETTVKMSKKEAGTKDESTEKIVMADSNINTRISDDENPDSTEATTRDYEDGEELTAVMDEHKNEAEEHSKTETSKQEEHSEQRYWPENEPRKQDPERFLDVASEEIQKTTTIDHDQTITYSEEQSLPASLEGNLEEEKKERTIHADEIEDSNITEEKVLETNECQDKLEPILNKTADSDSSTKSLEKSGQEISQEVEEREEHESAGVNKETEEVNIKQTAYEDIHSSAAGKVNVEENFKQEETNATKVKEEDKKSETECIEQKFDATCPTEETKDVTLKEEVKPKNVHDTQCTEVTLEETSATETKEDFVGNSSDSQVIEKETQDEILEKGEESVTGVTNKKILKKVEQEDEMQLEIPDLASEEKGPVTTGLCEAVSNDTDIVNEATNEAGKKQEHQLLNEKSEARNSCTDTEKVVLEQDTSAEASRSSSIKYVEIEKAVVELETEDHIQKTEDFATEDTNTIEEGNLELHGQHRSVSELVAQDQQNETLPEISVKDHNMECSGERIISQDLQKEEPEKNKEVEVAENHTSSTHDHIEIMKDVVLGEEVHGAVELAEESESFKEQHVREESCTTETQTRSALAETVNEIKEPDPVTTVNLQATNFRENEETASRVMEDLNREPEAFTITKTPEGNDEGTEKVDINITSSGIEDPTDRFEEENKEEADNCNGKMEAVPVRMITEVTSLEEIHLDDRSVLALDSTPDNSSLEMKSSDTTLDSAESDSANLGDSSGKISEHENPDKETGIVKIPDADEVEVEKAETSDAATNSKEQKFGDILEIGESLDRTDTCKLEKEPNKVLEATAESKYQGVEAVIEGEVTSHQTLPTGDLRQPLIDPSSEIPPKEEDREPTPIEKCEDKSRRNDVMLVNEVSEGSFATDTKQETCLHKENSREIEVSRSESKFIENKEDDRSDTATKEEGIAPLKSKSSKPEENVSMIECIEESFDTMYLSKETIAEVPKDKTKPDQDCKTKGEALLRNPTESQVSEKETKEEILENVELEVTDKTEETSLKNFEQGIIQLNSTELAFEGKGLVITGLQETGPADVDVKAQLAQASEMDENKGMRIPTAVTDEVYGAGEETEQEPENQTLNKLPKVEDERNITTVEALRSDVTGEGHMESSAQASSKNKLVTTEASETANVTSENVEASNNFNKKNSESTEPSEQVHGAFQLAEESENMKEQLVREESFTTELQTQSASAETINKIKESNPITIVNLQATDFIEIEETISQTTEDLIQESEAYIVTKPPEEGNDEGIEKHIGVTSSELEVSGELFKEENKEETDNINAEMDAAPVGLIKEETSWEEIHLDGSPVLAPEVENPETSNAATNSKELNVEDIPENGENLDTSDIYKVEKDSNVLETIAESKFQVVESDKSSKNDEMLVNEIAEHSFATNTKQETFLQNESSRELEVSKSEREFVGNIDDDMYKATASEPEENVSKAECAEHNSNATCHREETIAQAPKDEAKCNQDCQTKVETVMGEQTSTGSQVLEEETKEEILQDVELTDTGISEETSLKKVEQEDVVQLNSTDLASEDEGLVITGLQGTGSDDFVRKAELAQASEMDKNKDIQIPKPVTDEVYGAGEETEHEQENEIPNELPKIEDERNITTVESDVMEGDHKESSAQASRENKVVTTEVSETVNVPSENVRASYKGTPSEYYDEREEKLVQIEEKSVDASGDTDIVSTDKEKNSAHEETHDEDKDPCTIPVLNSKKKITESEQEDSLENSESNLTEDVEVEKAVELKAGDVSCETEGSEASTSILSEKNLESTGSCEQFRVTSVSVTENQSSKSLPQTSVKDQKSGSTEEKITEQDFQENQMGRKQEVQLTSDDEKQINKGQDWTEIIKDVISTEEVPGRFQKAEESDNIKDEIIKKESFPTELHKASRLTETGCEVTDSEPLPTVNFEPAEFSQHSETLNSQAAEDRNRVSEASSNIETPEEEMKAFIEKPITITSSAGQKDDAKEVVIVENLGIKFEGEEIEISDAVSNPKEQVVEDILGPERSLTMDRTGTYKPEEKINEVSEAICEPNYQGDEEVIEGDIVNTQTLPAGDLIYQLVEQSSAMELEPNKRNDSPDEPKKEERITLEEATSVETKGNFSELRLDDSLLDCTRDIELKEDMSKSEEMEMKEEHPKAITTQEAEENQSEKANDSNEITKSKISSEQTLEEKEVVMDSPMVSPSEETFGKSSQEDDVQMIENYAETTDQKGETMKNTLLNEQLSEELERATAAGDRADEDQHHSSVGNISLAHKEKNVEEVPIKVDLQEKNDGKDSGETDIEETILSKEEDNSSKVDLVKIGEDISVSGDKEIVIRTDEGQNSDFELLPVTDVVTEEAPREEEEEVSEPAPKEHSHETFETYNVKDETENTNDSESLVDDTKSKNTPLESALDRNGVPEEQESSANKLHISSPTESLNEEVADKGIRNTGDEKHNDLTSEEQERDEVSIPEKGIHVKDNGAHVEHEEPIDVLTKGGRMKLDDVESDSPMTANEDGETKEQNEKLNNASPHTKDSENEVSKEDGTVDVKNCSEISQDKGKDHLAIPDKQILIEPAANESTMAKISTGNKDVPIVQQLTSGNFLGAEPKAKEVACQEEKNTSTDLAKFSSQNNLQGASEEASQVAEDLTKERSLPENIEDPQADNTETAEVEEQKKDEDKDEEEEGDENKRVDSGYDAPVMVEASRDMDMKVSPPKKSHGILSGVGSKVKHSISKVKKVITGKSSHPKPPSPK